MTCQVGVARDLFAKSDRPTELVFGCEIGGLAHGYTLLGYTLRVARDKGYAAGSGNGYAARGNGNTVVAEF